MHLKFRWYTLTDRSDLELLNKTLKGGSKKRSKLSQNVDDLIQNLFGDEKPIVKEKLKEDKEIIIDENQEVKVTRELRPRLELFERRVTRMRSLGDTNYGIFNNEKVDKRDKNEKGQFKDEDENENGEFIIPEWRHKIETLFNTQFGYDSMESLLIVNLLNFIRTKTLQNFD